LTMLLAMVPFIGAAGVWAPCCLWLYFHDGRTAAAIMLAIYGAAVVSLIDNLIKPMVLHGRSNLHPLLALLSILGGVKVLGPIGIFVGPMAVTFLHVVLMMLQKEIDSMGTTDAVVSAVKGK
ncbi:MAG: AI-2E family transporter, partial [Pirellulales bacterium]|nr:AI-2E family transporter [Pirellulales bacterium]